MNRDERLRMGIGMLDACLQVTCKNLMWNPCIGYINLYKLSKLLSYMAEFGCMKVAQLFILWDFRVQLFNGSSVESGYQASLSKREYKAKRNDIEYLELISVSGRQIWLFKIRKHQLNLKEDVAAYGVQSNCGLLGDTIRFLWRKVQISIFSYVKSHNRPTFIEYHRAM